MTDKRPLAFACLVLAGLAIGSVSGVAQHQPVPAAPHACLEEERQAIEKGEGFGMALAADRHGYPGPKHILELKNELALTPEQEKQVRALFDQMRGRALMTGQRLLDKEAELEQLFVSSAAEVAEVRPRLDEIAALRAELRWVHLSTHLEARQLLTPEQRARYHQLRYATAEHAR